MLNLRKVFSRLASIHSSLGTLLFAVSVLGADSSVFSIRDYGAIGDGSALDTAAINRAIEACSKAGGGQVLFPPGRYLSGTVRLQSHVALFLDAGARLIGTTNLSQYQNPTPPNYMPEASWGKWHRGLIIGENLADVSISGQGIIDGNKVFDPTGEEHMRGPHGITFANCRNFTIRDVSIIDAANYAIFFQVSDEVDVRNVKIVGGWDGVHFRGAPERWCTNVNIVGCEFYTGDDSIAGRYWDNAVVSGCVINSSCNGLRVIGPVTRTIVHNCLFYGPGLQPHRTSKEKRRANMLSGIILQPGAWDKTPGPLDEVLISGVTMHNVGSPVIIWNKPGNTVGRITIESLHATGIYRAAISAESWAEAPITNLVIRNSSVEFAGGGKSEQAKQAVKGPGVDARDLPAWGLYARNVERMTVEDVRFSLTEDDFRPVVLAENVQKLTLDNFRYPTVSGVNEPVVTNRVGILTVHGTELQK